MKKDAQVVAASISREDLYERLHWLIHLRWLAAIGLLATILFARFLLQLVPAIGPLLLANGALVAANVVYFCLWGRWRDASTRRLVRFGVAQTIFDYSILTVVLHYTGGIENPLIVFFVFQCIIAAMLFTPILSYLLAGLALCLLTAMLVLERTGIWPHRHVEGYLPENVDEHGLFAAGGFFTLSIVLFVSVYLTTTIERASRRRRSEAAKRSRELQEAREQLQQADKMAALGELAASMAHDINNSAGVICTRLDVMEAEGRLRTLPGRVTEDFATLREYARYLRRIAQNWTAHARKSPAKTQRIDLNAAIRSTAEMTAESLQSHGIALEVRLHAEPLWVHGDLVRLQQVVVNLVNNAWDAMDRGGALKIVTAAEPSTEAPSHAVLVVEDTGKGIAPDELDRVFEPFYSRRSKGQGTGLGLAICQKIVKEMDGDIQVSSRLGEGTSFAIRLPYCASEARAENHVTV